MRFWLVFLSLTAAAFADDRAVAEWVIRQGGRVVLLADNNARRPVAELAALPTSAVTITGVDLYGTIIEPKDLEKLSSLTRIRELYLPGPSWNPGAGSRLDANEELKFLAPLKTLEKLHFSLHFLTNVNVQDKGLKHLETLTNLKELRLAQGRVKSFSFAGFTELEGLDLSYSTASDEVLKSLANLKHLRRLNLRDTLVTDDGLASLANIATLEEIDLYGLKISDRGLAHLKNLRELRKLNLLGGPVSDAGAEILAGLPKLTDLNLYRADLTNAGVARLSGLRELAFLDLRYTKATSSGVDKLRAGLPKCKVEFSGGPAGLASKTKVATPPAGAPEAAIAKWITDGMHGKAELRDGRIRAVSLSRSEINDSQLALIGGLGALETLDLDATEIGDLGLAAIAKCATLKSLRLDSTTVSDRGLASLTGLKQLERLSLAGTLVKHLAPLPQSVTDLDLSSTGIVADALAHVTSLPRLARLNVSYTDLGDQSFSKLGAAASLRTLDLTGTDIGDTGLAEVAKLTQLEELLLNHGRFTEKGLAVLSSLTGLRRFEAVRTRVGEASAKIFASLPKLEKLNLDYTSFDDAGLKVIAGLRLTELRLDSANITDASVDTLASFQTLKLLNLYHTLVSEDAHGRLAKALPDTNIIWDRDSKLPNRRGS